MVGGVFFLVWLSEQITRHGIGNGIALMLSVNILRRRSRRTSPASSNCCGRAWSPAISCCSMPSFWVALVGTDGLRRGRAAECAGGICRAAGRQTPACRRDHRCLPIKLNSAGFLIRPRVAPWMFYAAAGARGLRLRPHRRGWRRPTSTCSWRSPPTSSSDRSRSSCSPSSTRPMCVDPEHAAETLQKQGGVIPGVEPGEPTADYLDRVVSLTTVRRSRLPRRGVC